MKALFRLLREIYEYFWLYFGLIYFGIAGITCTIVSTALYPLLPKKSGDVAGAPDNWNGISQLARDAACQRCAETGPDCLG